MSNEINRLFSSLVFVIIYIENVNMMLLLKSYSLNLLNGVLNFPFYRNNNTNTKEPSRVNSFECFIFES